MQNQKQDIKISSNQRKAVKLIQEIFEAQFEFKRLLYADENGNKIGEYGTLKKLLESKVKTFLTPEFSPDFYYDFGHFCSNGYFFVSYIPTKDGYRKEDPNSPIPSQNIETTEKRERRFIVYACPIEYGKTGMDVYCCNEAGIYSCENERRKYSIGNEVSTLEMSIFEKEKQSIEMEDGEIWTAEWLLKEREHQD